MMPLVRMDCASSANRSPWKTLRGCSGLGSMESIGTLSAVSSRAGAGGVTGGRVGSKAPRPFPSALRVVSVLFMVEDLFCEFDVALCALRAGIVGEDRLSEARCLSQFDAAGDYGLEDLVPEELP